MALAQMIRHETHTRDLMRKRNRLIQQIQDKTGRIFEDIKIIGCTWYGYVKGIGWKSFTWYLNNLNKGD